jgi:hypothetical protein
VNLNLNATVDIVVDKVNGHGGVQVHVHVKAM